MLRDYIEKNAMACVVRSCDNEVIDDINILQATYKAMHQCLRDINIEFDRIIVDGDRFKPFMCHAHDCIPQGDNHYISIAAASILAKTHHDEWVETKCKENIELNEKYMWLKNMAYGTLAHRNGIIEHGITNYHRKSFCKKYIIN
jgi:ribonuclease HII